MENKSIKEKPEISIKTENGISYLEIKIPKELEKEIERKVINISGAIVTM
ncbi:MAG: hypothetical protein AABX77_01510 [Nanoarchaeota archaeon]